MTISTEPASLFKVILTFSEKVKLSFYRDGKVKTTTVTLTKNSNSES